MPEHVRQNWKYPMQTVVQCVALSQDGRFIFAGDEEEHINCFDQEGHLLWRGNVEGVPLCITIADGCERVLVGCSGGKAYLWNFRGQLLHTLETPLENPRVRAVASVCMTPTAHRIASGTVTDINPWQSVVALFDSTGDFLWKQTFPGLLHSFALTADGQAVVVGSEDQYVSCYDSLGREKWQYKTGAIVWAGTRSADVANAIVAGSNDHFIYLFGSGGKVRWNYDTGSAVNVVNITPDGHFVVAGGNARSVLLFNESGELLWKYDTSEDIYGLNVSDDGRFVLASSAPSRDGTLWLCDSAGNCLWTYHSGEKIKDGAMTPNGRLVVIAQDTALIVFENLMAPEDMSDAWHIQTELSRIRSAYGNSPYLGIATWFDTYDLALLRRELDLCRELLQEIRATQYQLSITEQEMVDSREGSLLLYQGLRFHQHEDIERARTAYEQSCAIQHTLPYPLGEGQALSALRLLQDGLDETSPALSSLIVSPPELPGNSQSLLAHRFDTLSMFEQGQVVRAAQQKGYLLPLLKASTSSSAQVQAAAVMALTWLQPGPEIPLLLELLSNPHWLVRWQACKMLLERANDPLTFALYRERVRQAVRVCLKEEQDPLVRVSLVMLLHSIGELFDVPLLLPLLQDTDPDVQGEAASVLGLLGTSQEIAPLHQIAGESDFAGRLVDDRAQLAIQRIKQRYPITQVQKVVFCHDLTEQRQPVRPATSFVTYNPVIHCVVTLAHPLFGTQISCTIRSKDQEPMQQVQRIKFPLQRTHSSHASSSHRSLQDWLHQLFAEEDETFWMWRDDTDEGITTEPLDIVFSFAPSRGTWSAGIYTVGISIDESVQYKQVFRVVNREALSAAPLHFQQGCISHEQKRYQEALVDYTQALKFDPHYVAALCSSGDVLIVRNLLQEASKVYAQALQLDLNAVLMHLCSKGLFHLLELNHYEEIAVTLGYAFMHMFDPTVQMEPSRLCTQLVEAAECVLWENKEQAFVLLEEITLGTPASILDHFVQAIAFALCGKKEEARAILDQSLRLISPSHLTVSVKVTMLALLDEATEAFVILDQALALSPDSLYLKTTKALVCLLLKRREEASVILAQALQTDPGCSLLYLLRGFVLFQLKRYEDMLILSEHMLRSAPDSLLATLMKGFALILLEREEGFTLIKQIIENNDDFLLDALVGIVVFHRSGRYQESLSFAQQLIQRLPNFSIAYFLEGENHVALQQYPEAMSVLQQSIALGLRFTRVLNREKEIGVFVDTKDTIA